MSSETTATYVGELIKKSIREKRVTNGYVIHALIEAGIEMNDVKFSNKIYGVRARFTEEEVKKIAKILKVDLSAAAEL